MAKRVWLVFTAGVVLLLGGCGSEEQQAPVGEPQPIGSQGPVPMLFDTNHTDPPIIIKSGGSLWRIGRTEHPDSCMNDKCCKDRFGEYEYHHFVNRNSYCTKNLDEGDAVLNADGTCVTEDNPALPQAFGHYGTMWAEESEKRYLAVDRRYVMTGVYGGKNITLTIGVGSAAKPNKWTIQAEGGPECTLVSDKNVDTVPPEFYQLDTLRRHGETAGARFPLSFSACKFPGCSGQ